MLRAFAAVDLGASSGRVALATLGPRGLSTEILHRFDNRPIRVDGRLVWDIDTLYRETIVGLRRAVARAASHDVVLSGIGVDGWGVDYAFVDESGHGPVGHYRDATGSARAVAGRRLSEEDVFALSGVRDQPINTSFRLLDDPRRHGDGRLLFVPDLWVHLLTGTVGTEPTIASTSQLLDARADTWSSELLEAYDVRASVLPTIHPTGSLAGTTTPDATRLLGSEAPVPVFRVGGHDTASAFAFAPPARAGGTSAGLISSGTWSLVGVPLTAPSTDTATREAGFTNERGVGSFLLLRNLNGMWLLQEGLREFADRGVAVPPIGDLVGSAESERPVRGFIDVADERLLRPASMLDAIGALCREAGLAAVTTPQALVGVVCDSLGNAYSEALRAASAITGVEVETIRMVGGGAQNRLLCQRTADLAGLPVEAGPIEASVLGNLAAQLHGSGAVASLQDAYDRLAGEHTRTYRPRTAARL